MVAKKFKATTNSKHNLPVAENLLNREFTATKPNQKMVSDITYPWTEEGWLYIAGAMDLFGQKIVGLSMSDRMTKALPINALRSAWLHSGRPSGALIHSDYIEKETMTKNILKALYYFKSSSENSA